MIRSALFGVFLAVIAALPAAPTGDAETTRDADPYARVRGMTISCHGSGRSWASDAMVETMAELASLGVNWVAIHPYAGIRADGTVAGGEMYADPAWLLRPIREAHRLGLKIMIKPHIAYWHSPFSWPGEIAFDDEASWTRFFDSYEAWITMVAALAREADAFVVGTELDATVHREAEWRRIIAATRTALRRSAAAQGGGSAEGADTLNTPDMPVTYSANWDRFERVGFWDALDVIGIQSYFPLVDHDGAPTQEELELSWERLLARLDAYAASQGRTIVLGELGYNRSAAAALRPWEFRQGGDGAEIIQQRCLRAALKAIGRSESVVGAFLWKWFPGESERGNFLMSTPEMRTVISECWARPQADSAAPP